MRNSTDAARTTTAMYTTDWIIARKVTTADKRQSFLNGSPEAAAGRANNSSLTDANATVARLLPR